MSSVRFFPGSYENVIGRPLNYLLMRLRLTLRFTFSNNRGNQLSASNHTSDGTSLFTGYRVEALHNTFDSYQNFIILKQV